MLDVEESVAAGHRLWAMAHQDTHQGKHVAHLMLGLYGGSRYPFDFLRLRNLDEWLLSDCITVLHAASAFNMCIDDLIDIPCAAFDDLAREQGLLEDNPSR